MGEEFAQEPIIERMRRRMRVVARAQRLAGKRKIANGVETFVPHKLVFEAQSFGV